MNHSGSSLADFFSRYRAAGEPLALATIASTLGSTYRKAGAQMLIADDGEVAGLLSGGCLENDLAAHAREVIETGHARIVTYDTRTSDDLIWGIGLGCEGAMQILLTRLNTANGYQPFAHAHQHGEQHRHGSFALVIESDNARYPLGAAYLSDADDQTRSNTCDLPAPIQLAISTQSATPQRRTPHEPAIAAALSSDAATFLIVPIEPPPRLLILGAGPDAMPLTEIAGLMGWHLTVLDHRPAYTVHSRFPRARDVVCQPANALPALLQQRHFDAAVVMSHHLASDETYLAALAGSPVGYVGLLGPAPRRTRLLQDIGARADQLAPRLYGPVGLDIGAHTPETIALAIVSEIQSVLAGRNGGSFSLNARRA